MKLLRIGHAVFDHCDCARQFCREQRADRSERDRCNKARRRIEQRQAKQLALAQ